MYIYIYTFFCIIYLYIIIYYVYDIFSVGVIQIEVGTSDHFDFDVCIFSDERWERTREVGCIEVLPCVKSSRLAISVSWLSGGIPRKMNDMAQCNMVAITIPNACRFACKSLSLHDFYAQKPGRIISQPWPFWFILQVQVRYGGYGSVAKVLHIPLHHECTNRIGQFSGCQGRYSYFL